MRKSLMSTQSLSVICNAHNHQRRQQETDGTGRRRSTGRNSVAAGVAHGGPHARRRTAEAWPRGERQPRTPTLPKLQRLGPPGSAAGEAAGRPAGPTPSEEWLLAGSRPPFSLMEMLWPTAVMGAQLCAHARHNCKWVKRIPGKYSAIEIDMKGRNMGGWAADLCSRSWSETQLGAVLASPRPARCLVRD